jgi:hypothetical protein
MKKTLIAIAACISFVFVIFISAKYFPDLYKEVKITDWISAGSSIFSAIIAFFAYRYAKNYLKQERHKNATAIALDIIHNDFLSIQNTLRHIVTLNYLKENFKSIIHIDKGLDLYEKIKNITLLYNRMYEVLSEIDSVKKMMANDIYKAHAVGCTLKNEKNDFKHILEIYDELNLSLYELHYFVYEFLMPFYDFEDANLEVENYILIENQLKKVN